MSQIREATDEELKSILATEARNVLIDFWSPWCAPCRTLRPHLRRMAQEYASKWRLVEVNAEAEADTAQTFGVRALPTLVFYRDGKESFRFSGTVTVSAIAEKLNELTPTSAP